ncbi:MAG: hypothetical protein AAE977_03620 [Thermoplasmataceae archaeon]|jgi:hypothetical protein
MRISGPLRMIGYVIFVVSILVLPFAFMSVDQTVHDISYSTPTIGYDNSIFVVNGTVSGVNNGSFAVDITVFNNTFAFIPGSQEHYSYSVPLSSTGIAQDGWPLKNASIDIDASLSILFFNSSVNNIISVNVPAVFSGFSISSTGNSSHGNGSTLYDLHAAFVDYLAGTLYVGHIPISYNGRYAGELNASSVAYGYNTENGFVLLPSGISSANLTFGAGGVQWSLNNVRI